MTWNTPITSERSIMEQRNHTPEQVKAFGEALREAIRFNWSSQSTFAENHGLTQSSVSAWINGLNTPPAPIVAALERALGLEPGELSWHLGYVPVDEEQLCSVTAAIAVDADLSQTARNALMALYRHFIEE